LSNFVYQSNLPTCICNQILEWTLLPLRASKLCKNERCMISFPCLHDKTFSWMCSRMGCSILSFGVAPNKQTLCLHPIFQISSRELWNPIPPSILRFFNSCANTTWFVLGCWICSQFYDKLTSFKIPFSASLFHSKWHTRN
jgi:hypothetical protein